jgi:hypothetical protein
MLVFSVTIPTWEVKIKKCRNVTLNTNMGSENKKM